MQNSSKRWSEARWGEVRWGERHGRSTSSPNANSTMRGDQGGGRVLSCGSLLVLRSRPSFTLRPVCRPCSSRGSAWSRTKGGYGLSRLWTRSLSFSLFSFANPDVSREIYSILLHDKENLVRSDELPLDKRRFGFHVLYKKKKGKNTMFKIFINNSKNIIFFCNKFNLF